MNPFVVFIVLSGMLSLFAVSAPAQSVPDLNGVWQGPYTPNLTRALGKEPPFTPYGKQRYDTVDHAKDPLAHCLPIGPNRGMQAPMPFQIVQSKDVVTILLEMQNTFRIIYLDGRKHPEMLADYPQWMGHSIGHFEGNTLVVETVGIDARTWIDTEGKEHSDKLRLIERFEKVNDNLINWTVTIEDPVFYTQPWSVTLPMKRTDTFIMSYSCMENEKDREHMVPTIGRTE
jgi:hypothetical protein